MAFSEVGHSHIHVVLSPPRGTSALKAVLNVAHDIIMDHIIVKLGKLRVVHFPPRFLDEDRGSIAVVVFAFHESFDGLECVKASFISLIAFI